MKIRRHTISITETERKISVTSNQRRPKLCFCAECAALVEMLPINEAARLVKKNWREIIAVIDSGAIHSSETTHGEIYLCIASLMADD